MKIKDVLFVLAVLEFLLAFFSLYFVDGYSGTFLFSSNVAVGFALRNFWMAL